MHFDRSVAVYTPKEHSTNDAPEQNQPNSSPADEPEQEIAQQPIDLKKRGRKKWTPPQLEFMQSALDFSSLCAFGFPLNSVCDRLNLHGPPSNAGSAVGKLKQYLDAIVGKERVVLMGIHGAKGEGAPCSNNDHNNTCANPDQNRAEGRPEVAMEEDDDRRDHKNDLLSLEDIEAMVGSVGREEHVDVSSSAKATGGHDQDLDQNTACIASVSPWTLCESWDACPIGTMPGYPG